VSGARLSAKGQTATWQQVRATSALPPQSGHALTRLAGQFRAKTGSRAFAPSMPGNAAPGPPCMPACSALGNREQHDDYDLECHQFSQPPRHPLRLPVVPAGIYHPLQVQGSSGGSRRRTRGPPELHCHPDRKGKWEEVMAKKKKCPFSVNTFLSTVDAGRTVASYSPLSSPKAALT
jgi:hypothetical protein